MERNLLNNFGIYSDYDNHMEILNDKDKFKLALKECLDYLRGVYETMPASNNEFSTMKKVMNFIESLEDYAYFRKESTEISDYYHDVIKQYRKELENAKKVKTVKMKYSLFNGWHEIQEGNCSD